MVERAPGWIVQLLDVVEAAHGLGIDHRDIKPSNVMVQRAAGHAGSR